MASKKGLTEAQWLREEKKKLIKEFGVPDGVRRWNLMQDKGWVKKKVNKTSKSA
jgi:hypothetical protein